YRLKYLAASDCAPAPNTLAAALLLSSFRNNDFDSFFSCSDASALLIAVITFSSASVIRFCCGVLAVIGACFCRAGRPPTFVDRKQDGWCDTSLKNFDSEVVYLSKAGQQAHSARILKRAPVDEAIL